MEYLQQQKNLNVCITANSCRYTDPEWQCTAAAVVKKLLQRITGTAIDIGDTMVTAYNDSTAEQESIDYTPSEAPRKPFRKSRKSRVGTDKQNAL